MSTDQPGYLAPPDVLRAASDAADDAICRRLDHHQVIALAADAVWRIAHERGHVEGLREAAAAAQRPCQVAYERGIAEGRRQATEGRSFLDADAHRVGDALEDYYRGIGSPPSMTRPYAAAYIALEAATADGRRLVGPWEPAEQSEPDDGDQEWRAWLLKTGNDQRIRRPRMSDGCGPEHTYRDGCEHAEQPEGRDRDA